MYFVHIYDEKIEDCATILCTDLKEVQKVLDLVDEHSDRFSLNSIEFVEFVMTEDFENEIKKSKNESGK